MRESNYEITKKKMSGKFLEYDQEQMIKKYDLRNDAAYLYLDFVGSPYRVNRRTGLVEKGEDDFHTVYEAGYNEAMSIYDVLCYARDDCCLSGDFCPVSSLKAGVRTGSIQPGEGFFQEEKKFFDARVELLEQACRELGGVPEGKGDVACRIQVFDFLPVIFQFWQSDEEFDAEFQFLWDENVLQYMHYETLWFVMSHITGILRKQVERIENS